MKGPRKIDDNPTLRDDAANLAPVLYRMARTDQPAYQRVVKTVRLVAPFFEDFRLEPRRLNPEEIKLEWKERGSDAYFDAHALSDGTLRFICLVTMLLQPERPSVFVIDEPELGLHPYAIQVLASLFHSVTAEFGAQVIAATQSTTLVNHLAATELIVVDRNDEGSTFRRLEEAELKPWLETYAMGELWEKNVLGGRPG